MRMRWIAWGLWLAAAGLLWFFENNGGTLAVLLLSVLLPLLSSLCAFLTARRVRACLVLPTECSRGDTLSVHCDFDGGPVWGCCLTAAVKTVWAMTGDGDTYMMRSGRIDLPAVGCGPLRITLTDVKAEDWFGLFSFPASAQANGWVTVQPRTYPVELQWLTDSRTPETGDYETEQTGSPADAYIGVRPYVPGDPVQMMHWKLTEKLDRPMLRQTGAPGDGGMLVAAETSISEGVAPDAGAWCAETLLSVSDALLASGIPHDLCVTGDGALMLQTVVSTADAQDVRETVQHMTFTANGDSTGWILSQNRPQSVYDRILLISPSPAADAASMAVMGRVTLILPATPAVPGETETVVLTPQAHQLILE